MLSVVVSLGVLASTGSLLLTSVAAQAAVPANNGEKPTIVLIHGAFADASSWQSVIPLLHKASHKVIAVQIPLRTFEEDVATTRRVVDAQKGPVVVVGHSYGGAVMTGAAAGAANVKALVYVTAFAPDANEKLGTLYETFGKPELVDALVNDTAGFAFIDSAKFHTLFAGDVSDEQAAVMWATQKPFAGAILGASVANPAWKSLPSWYLVTEDDRAIPAKLQDYMAKRIGAKVARTKSSHVPFVTKPKDVARIILEAASGKSAGTGK